MGETKSMTASVKTEIRFWRGLDEFTRVPDVARENGLLSRLAVIQETSRSDKVDMYFDEPLWRRLIAYAEQFSEFAVVEVVDEVPTATRGILSRLFHRGFEPIRTAPVEQFLEHWTMLEPRDREPPALIIVSENRVPILCIATEFWTRVGGPRKYADSYTYSIFTRDNREQEVRQFIANAAESSSWDLDSAT